VTEGQINWFGRSLVGAIAAAVLFAGVGGGCTTLRQVGKWFTQEPNTLAECRVKVGVDQNFGIVGCGKAWKKDTEARETCEFGVNGAAIVAMGQCAVDFPETPE
jgi:hypothetical protein